MNIRPLKLAVVLLGVFVAGCSSDEEEKKEHVFKDMTRTIDKAREVEGVLKDAAEKQKKAAEDSGN